MRVLSAPPFQHVYEHHLRSGSCLQASRKKRPCRYHHEEDIYSAALSTVASGTGQFKIASILLHPFQDRELSGSSHYSCIRGPCLQELIQASGEFQSTAVER